MFYNLIFAVVCAYSQTRLYVFLIIATIFLRVSGYSQNCAKIKHTLKCLVIYYICYTTQGIHILSLASTIDSRVKGLETDHVHTFVLYIEPSAVNVAPFNTS